MSEPLSMHESSLLNARGDRVEKQQKKPTGEGRECIECGYNYAYPKCICRTDCSCTSRANCYCRYGLDNDDYTDCDCCGCKFGKQCINYK